MASRDCDRLGLFLLRRVGCSAFRTICVGVPQDIHEADDCPTRLNCCLYGFSPCIKPPALEKYFLMVPETSRTDLDERDGLWSPWPMVRPLRPSLYHATFSALSSLSEIHHDINVYNEEPLWPFASREDIGTRARLAHRLETWKRGLDQRLTPGPDCMPHISHLEYVVRSLSCIASLRSNNCCPLNLKWFLYRHMRLVLIR